MYKVEQSQPNIFLSYRNIINECIIFGKRNYYFNMTVSREYASSVVLNKDTLWIVGGKNNNGWPNTTELIKIDSNQDVYHCNGIEMTFGISEHCMVQYNSSAIFLIGGIKTKNPFFKWAFGELSKETWIFDPTQDFDYKKGPSLINTNRYMFSCAKMKFNNTDIIVVAGGRNHMNVTDIYDSVEIFSPEFGWKVGK